MNVLGLMWIVFIVLKMLGIIAAGWFMVLFWPVVLFLCFILAMLLFGGGVAGIVVLADKYL